VKSPSTQDLITIASHIQEDLQKISDGTSALVSLHEINQWMGIKVDTFVNFLSLPDIEQQVADPQSGSQVRVNPREGIEKERSCVRDYGDEMFRAEDELEVAKLEDAVVAKRICMLLISKPQYAMIH